MPQAFSVCTHSFLAFSVLLGAQRLGGLQKAVNSLLMCLCRVGCRTFRGAGGNSYLVAKVIRTGGVAAQPLALGCLSVKVPQKNALAWIVVSLLDACALMYFVRRDEVVRPDAGTAGYASPFTSPCCDASIPSDRDWRPLHEARAIHATAAKGPNECWLLGHWGIKVRKRAPTPVVRDQSSPSLEDFRGLACGVDSMLVADLLPRWVFEKWWYSLPAVWALAVVACQVC